MLKTQPFRGIFLLDDKRECFQFSNGTDYLDQKMKFHDFSMTSVVFPGLENAFSNSMTFHDRMNSDTIS